MAHDWKSAYARQARADYAMFLSLESAQRVPALRCHALHFLQMATEKLAKAHLTNGREPPPAIHQAFLRFLRDVARVDPNIRAGLGMRNRESHLRYLKSLEPIARQIEALAPKADRKSENPEYPWESGGAIIAPAEHGFPSLGPDDPRVSKMMAFIRVCFDCL